MRYSLDIDLQIRRLLPTFKRTIQRISWLNVVLTPFKQIYNDFVSYREFQLNELSYNNQTAIFAYALNDAFDGVNRGISIDNSFDDIKKEFTFFKEENERAIYTYFKSENETGVYTYFNSEYGDQLGCTFNVPVLLQNKDKKIIQFIDKYMHTGINYTIKYY